MNKLIIIDGGFCLHRSVLAFRNTEKINPYLKPTYYFLRMILGYLKKLNADKNDQVIIALDGRNSWRKEILPTYKANRQAARDKMADRDWWAERFKEFEEAFEKWNSILNWHFIKIPTIEADDVAAVACRLFTDKEIILITTDHDWYMLSVHKNVKIMNPTTKEYKSIAKNASPFVQIDNGFKILQDKIANGDISDNVIGKCQNQIDYQNRKIIVDLINPLPENIEQKIKQKLLTLLPKNLQIHLVPYKSVQKELIKIYGQ